MLGSSSGDVVARQEVVAAATAHRVSQVASSTDNVEALQVLRSAVALASLSGCQHRDARQVAVDGLEHCEQPTERHVQRTGQHDHQQHRGDRSCERVR